MASIIRIKRSSVSGNPATLGAGELAYSALADTGSNGGDRLYIGIGSETSGNAVNHVVIGGKYFTDTITAATNLNTTSTLVKRDVSGNFSAGIITASLSGSATSLATGRTISLTGDVTYTSSVFDGTANVTGSAILSNTTVTAGSYGSSTAIPTFTVDSKGRLTAASTVTISASGSPPLTLNAGGSTTASVALSTDNLTFTGSSGITTSIVKSSTTSTLTIGIDSTVTTLTGTQTLTNKTLTNPAISAIVGVSGNLVITAAAGNNTVSLVPTGTGTVDVGNTRITSLADPTQAQDAATKSYVDAVKTGLDIKDSVRVTTTSNLTATYTVGSKTLTNTGTLAAIVIDSVALAVNDRVLVKDQSVLSSNGIYTVTTIGSGAVAWVLTRAIDFDNTPGIEITGGTFTFVEEGSNSDSGWVLITDGVIRLDTTNLIFAQFSGAGQINAGTGLTKTGNTIDVIGTSNRISVTGDSVDIDAAYAGQTTITTLGTIATGTWNASAIAASKGGTGITSYSANDLLVGTIAGGLTKLPIGLAGQSLQVNSTGDGLTYGDIDGGAY